jgi:hypothetical protein
MSIPPCLLHIRVHNEEHSFGIWLPLFLAWLILAILVLAFLPLFLILLIVALPFGWGEFMLLVGPRFYNILCALKGLKLDVDKTGEKVEILFV